MREGWVKKHLGEVCESKLGKTLNASTDHGEIRPYLCAVNVKWDAFDLATIKKAPFDADEIKKYSVQKGDLLVCEGGETGRAAIWDKEEPIQYQNALHRIRFKDGTILPRFCLHYLRYLKLSGVLDKEYSHGATILHLVSKSLYSIPIEYPSLPEQQRIVDILDREFAKIDALKANTEKSLQAAKDLFQATLKKELEPKEGWKTTTLGQSLKLTSGDNLTAKNLVSGPFPVYGGNGIMGYHNQYNLDGQNLIVGRVGALCGNVRLVSGKIWYTDNAFLVHDKQNAFYLPFLLLVLTNANLRQFATQAAQPVVSNASMKDARLSFPEAIEEQKRIVPLLDDLNDKCNTLQQNYQKTLSLCDDLKQSLLRKAFSGEL